MRSIGLATAAICLLSYTVPACAEGPSIVDVMKNPKALGSQRVDFANTGYSKLDQINSKNVKNLQVAWTFSTGVLRGHEGSPLVIGDMMYVHTPFPNIVYGLDLNNDGKIVWKYTPKQDPAVIPIMCCDTVNRGLAYDSGMIFLHQADTNIVALDAKSGKELWKVADGPSPPVAPRGAPVLRPPSAAAAATSRLMTRRPASGSGAPMLPAPTTRCLSIPKRPPRSANRSARIPR